MLRSEAVAMITQTLGFRRGIDNLVVTALQTAQISLENEPTKPWFLLNEDSTIRTISGEQRIPMPVDFLQEYEEGVFRYQPDDTSEEEYLLDKEDLDDLLKKYGRLQTGTPKAYAATGEYFRIFPIPDDDYLLSLLYYKRATKLSTDIENAWLKYCPMLLIGAAGKLIAPALGNGPAGVVFADWEAKAKVALFAENETRKHSNRSYQMGGAD